jgi:hypothetical protein
LAKEIFSRLFGVEPHVDQPHNVGLRVDGQETGLDPKGRDKGMTPTNTSSPACKPKQHEPSNSSSHLLPSPESAG